MTYEEKIMKLNVGKVVKIYYRDNYQYAHVHRFLPNYEDPLMLGIIVEINGDYVCVSLDGIEL